MAQMGIVMTQQIDNPKTQLMMPKRVSEAWTEIELENGDVIRAKIVVGAVLQIMNEDGTPAKHENSDTNIYGLNNTIVQFVFGKDQVTTTKKGMN